MRPLKIVLIVLGSLFALVAVPLIIGGLVLGWAYGTQRDDDGYFTAPAERFETDAQAITSDGIDLLMEPDTPGWVRDRLGDVRLRVEGTGGEVFAGIGPEADVEAYLQGVARDQITDLGFDPFEVEYRRSPGEQTPAPPGDQTFWVAQTSGAGTQTMDWKAESGRWVVVLMNTDGSGGVQAEVEAGGRSDLFPVAIGGLLGAGLVALLIGTALILIGALGFEPQRERAAGEPEPAFAAGAGLDGGTAQPVVLEGRLDEPLSRWLWLVKWLLAIPHFILLLFLWIAFVLLTFVAGVAILFTTRYPRGIFEFNLGVMRWTWRVTYYATSAIGTDRYPPFTLGAAPDYPATLDVAYPERLSRWLVLVKWWLLAIPHYLILAVLTSGPTWQFADDGDRGSGGFLLGGGGLVFLLVLIAGVVLLFRARYPSGVHALLMGINRWGYRVLAYAGLMTDVYPPFRLDQGATERGAAVAEPAPS
ncbi:MAG: DUF4389 domain-containing protein [Dehalococcoidia bacterium]|nr:DUF4389 domain-containing protein [Dehalococcoidia bacterium]